MSFNDIEERADLKAYLAMPRRASAESTDMAVSRSEELFQK
jgi:hypothetical protein